MIMTLQANNSIQIKICGLKKATDVIHAIHLKVDYLGFVLAKSSPRSCSIPLVQEIFTNKDIFSLENNPLYSSIKKVLVFGYNDSFDFICEAMSTLSNHTPYLQIPFKHSHFSSFVLTYSSKYIIPMYSVTDTITDEHLTMFQDFEQVILDTGGIKDSSGHLMAGGTGKTFDWTLLKTKEASFFIAGGLSVQNIEQAIQTLHPKGVDVSSGIEVSPGSKNLEAMTDFVHKVRSHSL